MDQCHRPNRDCLSSFLRQWIGRVRKAIYMALAISIAHSLREHHLQLGSPAWSQRVVCPKLQDTDAVIEADASDVTLLLFNTLCPPLLSRAWKGPSDHLAGSVEVGNAPCWLQS